ncbi:MAG: hypothetical protein GX600_00725 [Dehalococcoidia bacterium]|nr:hypothetical protein [Dehalococcoidia bacterium]
MKIAAGLVAVLLLLLGMVAAIGHVDGSIALGEPGADGPAMSDNSPVTGVEKAYLEFVINTLQQVSTDINSLGSLYRQPEMEDQYWKASVAVLLNRIEGGYLNVVELEPTERLVPFQDRAVEALDHSAQFARVIRGDLIEGQTELSQAAADELVAAAESFGEAEMWLGEFLEAHPLPE